MSSRKSVGWVEQTAYRRILQRGEKKKPLGGGGGKRGAKTKGGPIRGGYSEYNRAKEKVKIGNFWVVACLNTYLPGGSRRVIKTQNNGITAFGGWIGSQRNKYIVQVGIRSRQGSGVIG